MKARNSHTSNSDSFSLPTARPWLVEDEREAREEEQLHEVAEHLGAEEVAVQEPDRVLAHDPAQPQQGFIVKRPWDGSTVTLGCAMRAWPSTLRRA
jgi:hypothetical protein